MAGDLFLYAGILLIGFAVFHLVYGLFSNANPSSALQWASSQAPQASQSKMIETSRILVHQFTLQHAVKIKNPNYRKSVEATILTAGLENELNVDEYIGMQLLWGVMLPAILLVLKFALSLDYSVAFVICLGLAGIFLPKLHAGGSKKKRYQSVIVDLPFYIDLLALSTEAGLDFVGGLQKIVEKSEESVLSSEFGKVIRDIKLGSSREKALKDMAKRLDINEVSSFVNVVTDADATGASIVTVLKEQSNQMRLERFVRAEKAGQRATQLILFPIICFIMPAVFIIIFAPVLLQFYGGGN